MGRNEQPSDLVSRLERLRPKPEVPKPSRKLRILRWCWLATYFGFLFGTPLLAVWLQWQIHFGTRTATQSLVLALPICVLVVGSLLWTMKKLDIRPEGEGTLASSRGWNLYLLWVLGFAMSWMAAYLMLVAVAVLQSPGESTRFYRVTSVGVCGWAEDCSCYLKAAVQGHPALDGGVCIEDVHPEPLVEDTLEISGHFTPRGVYITDISNASRR
ncbi:hypothetical protein [Ramlibacter pallidus]|uniref:Uncharacterized protein n=1 Tax=Ramlibacter pallidus TaxID=2780087 RepID=A0ABR9S3R8_9BURK|nr:hypothetical protein [Ramlibacter pallidus]MBE7368169.1 hypothetical protein [Ramlibacter pallidus]